MPSTRPPRAAAALSCGLAAALALSATPMAGAAGPPAPARGETYRHAGTFYVQQNQPAAQAGDPTSAEILAFSRDRSQLLYTDSFTSRLGFVDSSDPREPLPDGFLDLPGEPTSVAVVGGHALVSVVTSADPDGDGPLNAFDAPSGRLLVVDLGSRTVVRTFELAGQPDAVAVAPSQRYAAIAIENERDEDENDGLLPQPPPGLLQVLDLTGGVGSWGLRDVALTGLADVAPEDPEPEYVDINRRDQAVVTLQENNHLVVVDLPTGTVLTDFSAGTVDLTDVDTVEEEIGPDEDGLIRLDGTLTGKRREPDAVQWVDDDTFATANEGDYEDASGEEGGSRSFTLFNLDGTVEYEAGNRFEHEVVRVGHYPEGRSENKGAEPEGLEVAKVGGRTLLMVAAERANLVGVYDVTRDRPRFVQVLPTGIGPEGLVARGGVLAVSAEVDGLDDGFSARPFITFFALRSGAPAYPMLRSGDEAGLPIPWVAQSGLSGDPTTRTRLWSVSDSFLGQAFLYRIRLAKRGPAVIDRRLAVGGETGEYDLEGVAARREGGFWLASEGKNGVRPNLLLRVAGDGTVLDEVALPPALAAAGTSNGFEGVAVTGSARTGTETVYVAVQREWADDPRGVVKIGRYDVAAGEWTFAHYPLDAPESPAGGWVGLSELTALPDGRLLVVERDNQLGLEARVKRLYRIDPSSVAFAPHGAALPVLAKRLERDLLPVLDRASIAVPDKVEGFALTRDGKRYLVTDNDGVDENYGETVFLRLRR